MFSRGKAVMGSNYNNYTRTSYYVELLPITNLLELLVINHSSSERRKIFVPWWSKLSCVLVVLQLAWVRTSPPLRCIRLSIVSGALEVVKVPVA